VSGGQIFFSAVVALYAFYIGRWAIRRVRGILSAPVSAFSERALRAKKTFNASIAKARTGSQRMVDDYVLASDFGEDKEKGPPDEARVLRAITTEIRSRTRKRRRFPTD
jgi:hypothetical protein